MKFVFVRFMYIALEYPNQNKINNVYTFLCIQINRVLNLNHVLIKFGYNLCHRYILLSI